MDLVIGILELVGLVVVIVYLFAHRHGKGSGCGCASTAAADPLAFGNPTGGCA
jgi:hypothetical protein